MEEVLRDASVKFTTKINIQVNIHNTGGTGKVKRNVNKDKHNTIQYSFGPTVLITEALDPVKRRRL